MEDRRAKLMREMTHNESYWQPDPGYERYMAGKETPTRGVPLEEPDISPLDLVGMGLFKGGASLAKKGMQAAAQAIRQPTESLGRRDFLKKASALAGAGAGAAIAPKTFKTLAAVIDTPAEKAAVKTAVKAFNPATAFSFAEDWIKRSAQDFSAAKGWNIDGYGMAQAMGGLKKDPETVKLLHELAEEYGEEGASNLLLRSMTQGSDILVPSRGKTAHSYDDLLDISREWAEKNPKELERWFATGKTPKSLPEGVDAETIFMMEPNLPDSAFTRLMKRSGDHIEQNIGGEPGLVLNDELLSIPMGK